MEYSIEKKTMDLNMLLNTYYIFFQDFAEELQNIIKEKKLATDKTDVVLLILKKLSYHIKEILELMTHNLFNEVSIITRTLIETITVMTILNENSVEISKRFIQWCKWNDKKIHDTLRKHYGKDFKKHFDFNYSMQLGNLYFLT